MVDISDYRLQPVGVSSILVPDSVASACSWLLPKVPGKTELRASILFFSGDHNGLRWSFIEREGDTQARSEMAARPYRRLNRGDSMGERHPLHALKRSLPKPVKRVARRGITLMEAIEARARLTFGIKPLSYVWGFDRGLPVRRHYLDQFLQEFASDIRGHCLEFQNPGYIPRCGGAAVEKLDILHIDDTNHLATSVADLTRPNEIPSNLECIVCTHVLHIIPEVDTAVSEMHRILKPGGVLLVGVPQVSMCDPDSLSYGAYA